MSAIVPHMATKLLKRDKIEILERLPLFETCTKVELGNVASFMIESGRSAGQYLTRQGRDGGLMFVIVDGKADVIGHDMNKGDKILGKLGPGDVVGELSLIDGMARSASVRAVTDVQVLELTRDDFYRLVHESPKFVRNLLRALSVKVRDMEGLSS
jgi:CRP-like cAMP-binding protein